MSLPGRNPVYYLMGHLALIHDRLLPMLGFGERLHPELDKPVHEAGQNRTGRTIRRRPAKSIRRGQWQTGPAEIEALPAVGLAEKACFRFRGGFRQEAVCRKTPASLRLAVSTTAHAMFSRGADPAHAVKPSRVALSAREPQRRGAPPTPAFCRTALPAKTSEQDRRRMRRLKESRHGRTDCTG